MGLLKSKDILKQYLYIVFWLNITLMKFVLVKYIDYDYGDLIGI